MKSIKLQTSIFISYLALAILIMTALSIFFYTYTSKVLIERETSAIIDLNHSFRLQVDQVIDQMDTVSINIGYSSLIKTKLGTDFNLDVSRDDFRSLANLFVTINGADTKVDQINLYDFSGNVLSVGLQSTPSKIDLSTLPWFEKVLDLQGRKFISLPYQAIAIFKSSKNPPWFISLYRTYYNQHGKEVGVIETTKQCKAIFKSIISYSNKDNQPPSTYIYDGQGNLIYPYQIDANTPYIFDYFSTLDPNTNHLTLSHPDINHDEIIVYEKSNNTDWTYVTVQPYTKILTPVSRFFQILIYVSFLLLSAIILISYGIAYKLTKPLNQLCYIIKNTNLQNLSTSTPLPIHTSIDEIKELDTTFQIMRKTLKSSMDTLIHTKQQELKSRNLALQSQINPHFYHNTLSSIMILAENNDCDKVIAMCQNLSYIMRYVTHSSSIVLLKEELSYIQQYLFCMKVRYQSSLNYTIEIHPELLELEIPKLIIQPLVENALKYGTNCEPPWHLTLISQIHEDSWTITIIDQGPGFTNDALTFMNERINALISESHIPDVHIDGMGLLNVYCRWKLFCEDQIIFHITNHPEHGGGMITIGKRRS